MLKANRFNTALPVIYHTKNSITVGEAEKVRSPGAKAPVESKVDQAQQSQWLCKLAGAGWAPGLSLRGIELMLRGLGLGLII